MNPATVPCVDDPSTRAHPTPSVPFLVPLVLALPAQDPAPVGQREEVTLVTAAREEQAWLEAPFAATVIEAEDLDRRFVRTMPQALAGTPGASVQETGYGQGSPYLRGFTGYQTLMLIDGIRLNNSVFRAGPNQYWSTVDPFTVLRLEIVRGPSSVLYGSDAIGGTANVITRGPWTWGEGFQHGESLHYRFASADTSDVVRGELSTTWGAPPASCSAPTASGTTTSRAGRTSGRRRTPATTSGPAT